MSSEQSHKSDARYFSIIDGTFRVQVSPDHPDAVARDWETKDGKKGTKYERIVQALFGVVEGIEFHDGDYGTNLNITLDKDEDSGKNPVLSMGTATPYGEATLKLLPNLVPGKEYRFRPFSFKDKETDKDIRGMEITERDSDDKFTVKIPNFFYDAETKTALNGYPTPEGDTSKYKSDDWKLFYLQARKHLIRYAEQNVLPRFSQIKSSTPLEYPAEGDVKPEDIPF